MLDIENLREATPEERESVNKYIESISVSTGVNFFDHIDPPGVEYDCIEGTL